MSDTFKEMVKAIINHRDKCFIPEDGNPEALYSWTERAKELLKN